MASSPQNTRTRFRPATAGSVTQTITSSESAGPLTSRIQVPSSGTLRLRAEAVSPQEQEGGHRHVQWAEEVVNNEGMGKKSSKVCCIYHKPRAVGESSSDESSSGSSSDDDSDTDNDDGSARHTNKGSQDRDHDHDHCDHGHDPGSSKRPKAKLKGSKRTASPNAYEKQPKSAPAKPGRQ